MWSYVVAVAPVVSAACGIGLLWFAYQHHRDARRERNSLP